MKRREVLIGLGAGGLLGVNALTIWMVKGRWPLAEARDQDVEAIGFGKGAASQQLVSVTADGTLSVWDSAAKRVVSTSISPNQGGATSVRCSECGNWLAAIGRDDHLWIWERQNPKNERALKLGGTPVSLAYIPPRGMPGDAPGFAVSLEDGRILFFEGPDPLNGADFFRQAAEFENWQVGPQSLVFSDSGMLLAGVDRNATIKIVVMPEKSTLHRFTEGESKIRCISFLPNVWKLAVGLENGIVDVWDLSTRTKVESLKGNTEPVASLVLTNDSVVVATDSGKILGQSLDARAVVTDFGVNPGRHQMLAVNDDRSVLASAWGTDVRFWSV